MTSSHVRTKNFPLIQFPSLNHIVPPRAAKRFSKRFSECGLLRYLSTLIKSKSFVKDLFEPVCLTHAYFGAVHQSNLLRKTFIAISKTNATPVPPKTSCWKLIQFSGSRRYSFVSPQIFLTHHKKSEIILTRITKNWNRAYQLSLNL